MASTYSSNLRLELIGTGDQAGTWGTTTNNNLGTLLEQAICGQAAVAVAGAIDYTLSNLNGTTDEARQAILNVSGTLTAAINVICPSVSKIYVVKNATTGGFAITVKTVAGTGISIANGETRFVYCDGTNVVNSFSGLTATSGSINAVTVGAVTPAAGAFTTLSASSTVSGVGFSTYLESPPAIGGTAAAAGNFTTLGASSSLAVGTTSAATALLDIGKAGTALGTMRLYGSTSGYTQIQPSAAAGSWTMTLPPDAGTNLYVLQTNGAGVTSWVAQSGTSQWTTTGSAIYYNNPVGIGTNAAPGALLDLGLAGTTLGTLRFCGNTSGYVQLQSAAAAGSWTMTLPTSAGTNGYVLSTNGSGVTSWVANGSGTSQWTTATNGIYYSGGNVVIGATTIGTTPPFMVVGAGGAWSNTTSITDLRLGTGASDGRLQFGFDATNNYGWIRAVKPLSANSALLLQPDSTGGSQNGVGIGLTSISYLLQLGVDSAAKPSTTTWTTTSEDLLKTIIAPYTLGLPELLRLNPIIYDWNGADPNHQPDGTHKVSVLASEAQSVDPSMVSYFDGEINGAPTRLRNLNPHNWFFMFINAFKTVDARLKIIESRLGIV